MTTDALGLFPDFADAIRTLPFEGLTAESMERFVLHDGPKVKIVYAPFDWVNPLARVAVVGITPGDGSMNAAFRAARAALLEGKPLEEAAKRAKRTGSFSNMRGEIAKMFDELGLATALGIPSALSLFDGADADLMHSTSCVRYPIFYKRDVKPNYSGRSPDLMKYTPFVRYIEDVLAPELVRIPKALIVPCGEMVTEALRYLERKGIVKEDRCLLGFPHASGQNGHRKRHFNERKEAMRLTVSSWSNSRR
jgi:hypothetical protein